MGPRLFSRGMDSIAYEEYQYAKLQWGRGSSAAECKIILNHPGPQWLLQWGRGSSAAECA